MSVLKAIPLHARNPAGKSHGRSHLQRLAGSCIAATLLLLTAGTASADYRTRATAIRRADLQVGVGLSFASSDYAPNTFKGISGYVTYDFSPHWGAEFMIHQLNGGDPDKIYERTYELGPRYVRHYGRFDPYVRPAYGRGVFNFPNGSANLAYNMFTVAAGADVHVLRHLNVRGAYEVQRWMGFPGYGEPRGSLAPQIVTVGAAYHF